jgi:hypothetical protein
MILVLINELSPFKFIRIRWIPLLAIYFLCKIKSNTLFLFFIIFKLELKQDLDHNSMINLCFFFKNQIG